MSVGVGVFKILYQDQGVCQGYLSVSCQGMSKVYIGVSRYLSQCDDVGMSEGVSILLGYVRKCLIGRACIASHEVDVCVLYKCECSAAPGRSPLHFHLLVSLASC